MSSPKEKARELINKYMALSNKCNCLEYMCTCFTMYPRKAKQCALIAVDEILENSRSSIPILIPSNELVCSPEYWQEVKKEIEKL